MDSKKSPMNQTKHMNFINHSSPLFSVYLRSRYKVDPLRTGSRPRRSASLIENITKGILLTVGQFFFVFNGLFHFVIIFHTKIAWHGRLWEGSSCRKITFELFPNVTTDKFSFDLLNTKLAMVTNDVGIKVF